MGSKVISLRKRRAGASKSLQKMEQIGSCRIGEYGSSYCLVAVLGLKYPVTEGKELPLTLFCFIFYPLPLSSELAVGPWRWIFLDDKYSVVWSVTPPAVLFPSRSVWQSGYQVGRGREEAPRWLIRSQSSLHFSPAGLIWQAYPSCCLLVMVRALGDHITSKSFTGLQLVRVMLPKGRKEICSRNF